MGILSQLEPKEVFSYFEEICAIPHPSYHEGKISDYCAAFAQKHGLVYYQDEQKNIIIIKEATKGYEKDPALIIQGHLDMVCEKEPGSSVDFEKDGLKLIVEGDYITADGTTLGADDGIAVAYALAILGSDTVAHPKLEVVFTVSEEVGMEGASGIDVSMLEGRMLLNLDSEEEGIFLAGCAGGASAACTLPVNRENAAGCMMSISITGLTGGHSGVEINQGRANANILMGRIFIALSKLGFHLAAVEGGKKDNAIPRDCTADVFLAPEKCEEALRIIAKMQDEIKNEYAITDKNIKIRAVQVQKPGCKYMLDQPSTKKVVTMLNALPNGVQSMSADVEGLVETSLNVGVLELNQSELVLRYAVRSCVGSAKDALIDKMAFITEGVGGNIQLSGVYPAWEYKRESVLRDKMAAVYERMYQKKPLVQAIHAGVECGLLAGKLPGLDCISIGPDIQSVHTTEEKLSIPSTRRVWEYILEVLKQHLNS